MGNLDQGELVSVILPVYNGEAFLAEAIESILSQTYRKFELLLIYTESLDRTAEICRQYQGRDSRVRVIQNRSEKIGISGSLNTGLAEARGEFIARIDADDVAMPDRLAAQVAYLLKNPKVAVLGTHYQVFRGNEDLDVVRHPTNPIINALHFCALNVVGHPTVLFRKTAVEQAGAYRVDEAAEDYGLFARVSRKHEVVNLPWIGLRYRMHSSNLSVTNGANLSSSAEGIGREHYRMILCTERGYWTLRCFLLSSGEQSMFRRVVGFILGVSICVRIAFKYGGVMRYLPDAISSLLRFAIA